LLDSLVITYSGMVRIGPAGALLAAVGLCIGIRIVRRRPDVGLPVAPGGAASACRCAAGCMATLEGCARETTPSRRTSA